MSTQLSQNDFQRLVQIIYNLPDFSNVRDRRRLLIGALEGVPQSNTILSRLDLDGSPMSVCVDVIRFLCDFGQVAYGKEALGVFLNYVQPFIGDGNQDFIVTLFARYPLNASINLERPISKWLGVDNFTDIREKIIGEDTLRHINTLELALEAAKVVVHLCVPKRGYGTGFLFSSNLLMTNNHVISNKAESEITEYTFNYQLDRDGNVCSPLPAYSMPDGLFYTNAELDYTVVQLKEPPLLAKPLNLDKVPVRRDSRVTIIQHPSGHLKKISMQNNFVAYADAKVVQYTTSTLPGSSGSPVFNDDFKVVAIHHSGGMLTEPGTMQRYERNAGSSMIAILDDLKVNAPQIYAQIAALI
jgi:hypothetical protein